MSGSIPLDIELEIMKRLPVKSLIRFMSVCKAWKSLIKCSEFVAGYRALPTQPQHLMVRYEVGDEQEPAVKFVCFVDDDTDTDTDTSPQQKFTPTVPPILQLFDQSRIIDSSCGLLCLAGYFREPDNSQREVVVLWNPAIRKSIAVDVPNVVHDQPFKSVIGFGVCPDTKDPKLVNITYIHDQSKIESISCIPNQVMVFTLSSGEWTCLCSNQRPRKSIKFTCSQAVIGQFIYWLACDRIAVDNEHRDLIMSFDMSSQEFREIDLPDCLAGKDLSISRLRESLVLLEDNINFTANKQICDVWMMEHGDSKAVTKLFTINPPNASVLSTLGFRNTGEPIIQIDDYDDDDDNDDDEDFDSSPALVLYESCSEHIKDLGICGKIFSFSVYSYTPSLLLLDHDDGHILRCGDVKM